MVKKEECSRLISRNIFMLNNTEKSDCCGCEACVQICPKQCISFAQDQEGFFYPKVNRNACIQCGLCEKVCPMLHPYERNNPQDVMAAINKDDEVRMASSSGGIFTLLAERIITQGGVVFGVRFDNQWQAVFDCTETMEALAAFRGSKYVQARVGDSFRLCKQLLDQGRQVLFSGTQCQIAGLHHFLQKSYSNLLTVDFICHGVPSPKVWSKYLEEAVAAGVKTISCIDFRDKRLGWKRYSFTLKYEECQLAHTFTSAFSDNPYMKAFLSNLILRPSCYSCHAKGGRSKSDITIADFWGINKVNPFMDDDMGTSLVLIYTDKGRKVLDSDSIRYAQASYEKALRYNPSLVQSALKNPRREDFFASFCDEANLHTLIKDSLKPTKKQLFYKTVNYPLILCKRFVKICIRILLAKQK